jgi:hypothetical protein
MKFILLTAIAIAFASAAEHAGENNFFDSKKTATLIKLCCVPHGYF